MRTTRENLALLRPTPAFIGASWLSLLVGTGAYLTGLFNASMALNEKGYYFAILVLGLFAAISLQKTVRDRAENIPVTNIYTGVCWVGFVTAVLLLLVGLWNATLTMSEKGFYGMSFTLSLFAVIAVQKNIRDANLIPDLPPEEDKLGKEALPLPEVE